MYVIVKDWMRTIKSITFPHYLLQNDLKSWENIQKDGHFWSAFVVAYIKRRPTLLKHIRRVYNFWDIFYLIFLLYVPSLSLEF